MMRRFLRRSTIRQEISDALMSKGRQLIFDETKVKEELQPVFIDKIR